MVSRDDETENQIVNTAGEPIEKPIDTDIPEDEETYEERILRLASTYEAFHAGTLDNSNHGKKNKSREKDKKGSGRAAGVVKGAGLKSQLKKKSKAKSKETSNGAKTKANS
jgi:hypothetical protein